MSLTNLLRQQIRAEVNGISLLDDMERQTQSEVLNWIDSDEPLFRTEKPATPPKHLVSYFVLIDGDHVLLVDHINAGLWLPSGGHVEPGEHPRTTVQREVLEELSIEADFIRDDPVFLTSTETVGPLAKHVDVSLWYLLRGDRRATLDFDQTEFYGVRWFHRDEIPYERCDPQMHRFIAKV